MYHESRGVPYSLTDPPLEVLPHPGPSSCLHRHLVAHGSHCHLRRGSAGGPSPEKIPSGAWGSLKELRNSSEIQLTRLKRQAAAGGGVGTGGHGRQESKERERS